MRRNVRWTTHTQLLGAELDLLVGVLGGLLAGAALIAPAPVMARWLRPRGAAWSLLVFGGTYVITAALSGLWSREILRTYPGFVEPVWLFAYAALASMAIAAVQTMGYRDLVLRQLVRAGLGDDDLETDWVVKMQLYELLSPGNLVFAAIFVTAFIALGAAFIRQPVPLQLFWLPAVTLVVAAARTRHRDYTMWRGFERLQLVGISDLPSAVERYCAQVRAHLSR